MNSKRLAHLVQALVVAFAAVLSLVVVTPAASAAGTSAPDLRFCLSYANGTAYASKPVYLYRWDTGRQGWVHYRSGTTASNGCATWRDVLPNTYHYVQGYWTQWVGGTGYYYNGNTGSAWVGGGWDRLYSAGHGYVHGPYRLY